MDAEAVAAEPGLLGWPPPFAELVVSGSGRTGGVLEAAPGWPGLGDRGALQALLRRRKHASPAVMVMCCGCVLPGRDLKTPIARRTHVRQLSDHPPWTKYCVATLTPTFNVGEQVGSVSERDY